MTVWHLGKEENLTAIVKHKNGLYKHRYVHYCVVDTKIPL